jgi:hypothetical protein
LNPEPEKRNKPEEILSFEGFNKFRENCVFGKETDIGFLKNYFFVCIKY